MKQPIIYIAGASEALHYAGEALTDRGFTVTDRPAPDVTHLLLPVPSFDDRGRIRGDGPPEHLLGRLPENITIIGGNLIHPILQGYPTVDLLQDPYYVAENAAITSDCAIRVAAEALSIVWAQCPVLIIGWGRIGKTLAPKLKALGADVFIAVRKESDLAMLRALGYRAESTGALTPGLLRYRVIFNTVPAPVLTDEQIKLCRPDCVRVELASTPGMPANGAIRASGLPGKLAPESSGQLIAKTVIRLLVRKENTP
jgi:dipicolinate synthase subunit A